MNTTRPYHPIDAPAAVRTAVWFPLWLKLGVMLGAFVAVVVAGVRWRDFEDAVVRRQVDRELRQRGVAAAVAAMLDGDEVAQWDRRGAELRPAYQAAVDNIRAVRSASDVRWIGLLGRRDGRVVYLLDGEEEDPVPALYPFFDVSPALTAAFAGELGFGTAIEDEFGVWDSAFAPIADSRGRVTAVAVVDLDADWREETLAELRRAVLIEILATAAAALAGAILFSRYLARHLARLASASEEVARGRFDVQVAIESRDEVGVLASSFNTMVSGLRERDFLRDAFGRYLPESVTRLLLSDPEAMRPGGRLQIVTVMMSDLRGYTSLTAELGPQATIEILNAYLSRMTEVIEAHGGTINEFIGDAILALFGAPHVGEDDARRAVTCAARMQAALDAFNQELAERGVAPLEMGIGIDTGEVMVGNIGSMRRVKWGVLGDTVNRAARVESFTVGGEVLITADTREAAGGDLEVRGPIAAKAKGQARPLEFYAVIRAGDAAVPGEVAEDDALRSVQLTAIAFLVVSKEVSTEALHVDMVSLGERTAVLEFSGTAPEPLTDLELQVMTSPVPVRGVYGKVLHANWTPQRCVVRFTSLPADARARLLAAQPAATQNPGGWP